MSDDRLHCTGLVVLLYMSRFLMSYEICILNWFSLYCLVLRVYLFTYVHPCHIHQWQVIVFDKDVCPYVSGDHSSSGWGTTDHRLWILFIDEHFLSGVNLTVNYDGCRQSLVCGSCWKVNNIPDGFGWFITCNWSSWWGITISEYIIIT